MRQLTTLSLFLFLLLNLCSTNLFSKEKNPTFFEEESATFNNLFLVLDPMEPTCMTCSDGAIQAMAAGGIAPYTYDWSTGDSVDMIINLAVGTYTVTVTDLFGCSTVDSVSLIANSGNTNLTLEVFTLATTCFGSDDGNAVAVVNGGMMPYTYAWSTGDSTNTTSNLLAGMYTVTVTDANAASLTETIEIIQPSQLTVVTTSMSGCEGPGSGMATAFPTGGVFPYTYAWSTGDSTQSIVGLSTGTFGVTVTDGNGCVAEYSDFIIQPIALNVNPEPTAPSCFNISNGDINASVWGGTEPYTFAWSNGETIQTILNLSPGNYTVTVTDMLGCTVVGSVFLDAGNPLDITVQGISTVSCIGDTDGALLINAFGGSGSGYTYLWENGDTGAFSDSLASGFHLVTVTDDNQCSHVDSVFVNSPLALNSSISATASCAGANGGTANVVPSGGTLPYTFAWSNGMTNQILTNIPPGPYDVTITDMNGCTTTNSITVPVDNNTFTAVISADSISCANGNDGTASVTPTGGVAPYTYLWSNGMTTATINDLTAGGYSVTITDAGGCDVIQAVSVPVPSPFAANATIIDASGCGASGSITLNPSGGIMPYSYNWFDGSTGSSISELNPGTYGVDITDGNGCAQLFSFTVVGTSNVFTANITSIPPLCFDGTDGSIYVVPMNGTAPYSYLWNTSATDSSLFNLVVGNYIVTITDATGCAIVETVVVTSPPPIIANETVINASGCGTTGTNGSITLNPSGGNAPYTYMWSDGSTSNSLSGLAAGTYTVDIFDAIQCSQNFVFNVGGSNNGLTATITNTPVNCFNGSDGSASVVPTSGVSPYTYLWSTQSTEPNIIGLVAGQYTVTVTDVTGCEAIETVIITESAPIIANETVVNASGCGTTGTNGSITLNPSGGNAPYTYNWSTGSFDNAITNLVAGTYTVGVVDANNCVETFSFDVVSDNNGLTAIITSTLVNCFNESDGSASAVPTSGVAPYTYLWSTQSTDANIFGLAAGVYTVTVNDATGCEAIETVTITESAPIIANEMIVNAGGCGATGTTGSITLNPSGGNSPYTYNWSTGSFDNAITNLVAGTYTVGVVDANNCVETFSFDITSGGTDNPPMVVTQDITVSLNANNVATITVSDIDGGTTDDCGIDTLTIDQMTFDCSHIGNQTVTLTATDSGNNTSTGTAIVTVVDDIAPTIVNNNATIYLDAQGMATITAADIVTITDNCNVDSITLGLTQFDCSNLGMNLVTVQAQDASGNTAMLSALLTVADTIPAVINCSVPLTAFACDETVAVVYDPPTVTDNCDATGAPVLVSGLPSGSEFPVGTTTNTYSYTDPSGNTVTCSFDIVIFQGSIDITVDTITQPTAGNSDGAIEITVTGANPLTYEWFLNGTLVSTDEDPTGLMIGSYEVIVTDVNGCTQSLMIDFMTAINNPEIVKNIQVYPNPTSDQLFVNIDLPLSKDTEIQLFNLDGKVLLNNSIAASQNQIELNVSSFASGIYILKITIDNEIVTKRVTVSR